MKFYTTAYRDSFQVMQDALEAAGHVQVSNFQKADCIFLDREPTGNEQRWNALEKLSRTRPIFIYPHTPYAFWLWDGYTRPIESVACNFIVSRAAQLSMETYGYPCRTEIVGFTRPLTVKQFQPTTGRHLAFSGPRLLGTNGRWYRPSDKEPYWQAMEWIVKYRDEFEKITIFHTFSLEHMSLEPYEKYGFNLVCVAKDAFETKQLCTASALKQLQDVDIFIGSNTLGYIAISQGIPTVLVGHNNDIPRHSTNNSEHYADYAKFCDFPLRLEEMTANDVKQLCQTQNSAVEFWKNMNIGTDFNAEKFMSVVREFL